VNPTDLIGNDAPKRDTRSSHRHVCSSNLPSYCSRGATKRKPAPLRESKRYVGSCEFEYQSCWFSSSQIANHLRGSRDEQRDHHLRQEGDPRAGSATKYFPFVHSHYFWVTSELHESYHLMSSLSPDLGSWDIHQFCCETLTQSRLTHHQQYTTVCHKLHTIGNRQAYEMQLIAP
jgi:hypothetical protein